MTLPDLREPMLFGFLILPLGFLLKGWFRPPAERPESPAWLWRGAFSLAAVGAVWLAVRLLAQMGQIDARLWTAPFERLLVASSLVGLGWSAGVQGQRWWRLGLAASFALALVAYRDLAPLWAQDIQQGQVRPGTLTQGWDYGLFLLGLFVLQALWRNGSSAPWPTRLAVVAIGVGNFFQIVGSRHVSLSYAPSWARLGLAIAAAVYLAAAVGDDLASGATHFWRRVLRRPATRPSTVNGARSTVSGDAALAATWAQSSGAAMPQSAWAGEASGGRPVADLDMELGPELAAAEALRSLVAELGTHMAMVALVTDGGRFELWHAAPNRPPRQIGRYPMSDLSSLVRAMSVGNLRFDGAVLATDLIKLYALVGSASLPTLVQVVSGHGQRYGVLVAGRPGPWPARDASTLERIAGVAAMRLAAIEAEANQRDQLGRVLAELETQALVISRLASSVEGLDERVTSFKTETPSPSPGGLDAAPAAEPVAIRPTSVAVSPTGVSPMAAPPAQAPARPVEPDFPRGAVPPATGLDDASLGSNLPGAAAAGRSDVPDSSVATRPTMEVLTTPNYSEPTRPRGPESPSGTPTFAGPASQTTATPAGSSAVQAGVTLPVPLQVLSTVTTGPLQERVALCEQALERLPWAVMVVDADNAIAMANPAVRRLLHTTDRPIGRTVLRTLPEGERVDYALHRLRQTAQEGRPGSPMEVLVESPAVRLSIEGLVDPVMGYLGALVVAGPRSETSSSTLTEFIPLVTDALEQPIRSILGYREIWQKMSYGDDPYSRYLQKIDANLARMRVLLGSLQTMVQNEVGPVAAPARVDVAAEVERALEDAKPHLDEKAIRVNFDLKEALPAASAEPEALRRILDNLLVNAAHRSPQGGDVQVKAEVRSVGDTRALVISVFDRGSQPNGAEDGMIDLDHGRAGAAASLKVVRALAERQGGKAWIENPPEWSGGYHVRLPLRLAA